MDRDALKSWLDAYVAAWKSYERDAIAELFSERAEYRYHPDDEPIRGRRAIVESWLADRDEAGTYDGHYEPFAVEGDAAVATGTSTYYEPDGSVQCIYDNCYVMRFDPDGRCREFTEWFRKRPSGQPGTGS